MRKHENKCAFPVPPEQPIEVMLASSSPLVVRRRDMSADDSGLSVFFAWLMQYRKARIEKLGRLSRPKARIDAQKSTTHGLDLTQTAINSRRIQFHHLHRATRGCI